MDNAPGTISLKGTDRIAVIGILKKTLHGLILLLGSIVFTVPIESQRFGWGGRLAVGISALMLGLVFLSWALERCGIESDQSRKTASLAIIPYCLGLSALPFLGFLLLPVEVFWAAAVLGEYCKASYGKRLLLMLATRIVVFLPIAVTLYFYSGW